MSLISAVQSYLKSYSQLKDGAPLWVDYLGSQATEYAVYPLPGARIVEQYLNGGSLREYPFAFQSTELTADDQERLETLDFYEAFAEWLDAQTLDGILPDLGTKRTADTIAATGWAYLYQQGQSDTGIYQIQIKLTYTQDPR